MLTFFDLHLTITSSIKITLSHAVIAKHTHLSPYAHTYTRTHTLTLTPMLAFLIVEHTTNKLNILKMAKQPVKRNGSSCSPVQTFLHDQCFLFNVMRLHFSTALFYFLTKHIAITNIKFQLLFLKVCFLYVLLDCVQKQIISDKIHGFGFKQNRITAMMMIQMVTNISSTQLNS